MTTPRHDAVAVDVGGVPERLRAPRREQPQEVNDANDSVTINVAEPDRERIALILVRSHVHDDRDSTAGVEVDLVRREPWVTVEVGVCEVRDRIVVTGVYCR